MLTVWGRQFDVLCIGMGGAGKSTILSLAAGEETDDIEATKGFNIKAITTSRAILNVKELGGGDSVRPYWCRYLTGVEAVIVVVDIMSNDNEFDTAYAEISALLEDSQLTGLPLMVLLNKQDLGYKSEQEVQAHFDIEKLRENHDCCLVFRTSCDSLQELKLCFEEMSEQLLAFYLPPEVENSRSSVYNPL
ncbi:ADP-ribosylation factor-like protein 15 isoform X2 [Dysidea avara]|uniref:ADP-ribosylation factor-like protein 15 isoform X2 n=1 Tax=Dysidea avara TaxID=196820 RepID=UPI00332E61C9